MRVPAARRQRLLAAWAMSLRKAEKEGCARIIVQVVQATPQHEWEVDRDRGGPLGYPNRREEPAGRPLIRFVP